MARAVTLVDKVYFKIAFERTAADCGTRTAAVATMTVEGRELDEVSRGAWAHASVAISCTSWAVLISPFLQYFAHGWLGTPLDACWEVARARNCSLSSAESACGLIEFVGAGSTVGWLPALNWACFSVTAIALALRGQLSRHRRLPNLCCGVQTRGSVCCHAPIRDTPLLFATIAIAAAVAFVLAGLTIAAHWNAGACVQMVVPGLGVAMVLLVPTLLIGVCSLIIAIVMFMNGTSDSIRP